MPLAESFLDQPSAESYLDYQEPEVSKPEEKSFLDTAEEKIRNILTRQEQANQRPLIPTELARTAIDVGTAGMGASDFLEGARQGAAEMISGMSTPENINLLPAFTIPYVGQGLALGMGAKALGSGLGRAEAALESGNTRELGSGLVEAGGGASMLLPAALPLRHPTMPAELLAEIKRQGLTPEQVADAQLRATNLGAPGTVRPQEITALAPPSPEQPPMFKLGEVPFKTARRFGTQPLPPVEILPKSGRLSAVEVLDEPRSLEERETRGKISFGAEAPTLVRTAIDAGNEVGLTKSAEALAEAERTNASTVRSNQGQLPQEGQAVEGGEKIGGNDLQQPPSGAPVEARSVAEVPKEIKSTEAAWELGAANRTPEGIGQLAAREAELAQQIADVKASDLPPAEKLNRRAAIAPQLQLVREALSAARGETGRPAMDEYFAKKAQANESSAMQSIRQFTGDRPATEEMMTLAKQIKPEEVPALEKLADDAAKEASDFIDKIDQKENPSSDDLKKMSQLANRQSILAEAVRATRGEEPATLARGKVQPDQPEPSAIIPENKNVGRAVIGKTEMHNTQFPAPRHGDPDLVLLGCAAKKLETETPVPAADLYTSQLFKSRRNFAESQDRPWMILSAQHGVVEPGKPLVPYDTTITSLNPEQRQIWRKAVRQKMLDYFGGRSETIGKSIEVHAGKDYVNALNNALEGLGINVVGVLSDKGIGSQLAEYKKGYTRPQTIGGFGYAEKMSAKTGASFASLQDIKSKSKPRNPAEKPPTPDWNLISENLRDDLDSFSPARHTGKIDQPLMDAADRFIEFAKTSKEPDLLKIFNEFKKQDEASPSQKTKIGKSLENIVKNRNPDIIKKLEDLRDKFDASGDTKLFSLPHPDAFKGIAKSVIYTALDIAIQAIKAGRTLNDAVSAAMAHIGATVKSTFDPAKIRANFEHIVSARTNPADLKDIYEIFEPEKSPRPGIAQIAKNVSEAFRTGFSSRFRPLNKLAEDISKAYPTVRGTTATPKDIAGIFEQLKGSSGKAEADIYRFDQDVAEPIKGHEKDFNAYLFLRRSLDRLRSDLSGIAKGEAPRRSVSLYTIPELEGKLATLESKVGPDVMKKFQGAADAYQAHLDDALRLQVESGRMTPEVYNAIKSGNDFYAPFKLLKYMEETRPDGSGRSIQTLADYTKAMKGIEDPNVKLGELLPAARQNIYMSRVLAEKNLAMRELSDLAIYDLRGDFIRKLGKTDQTPEGFSEVKVLENGTPERYAVNKNVSDAVQAGGPVAQNVLMRFAGNVFRAGATTFNVPFQVSNLLADQPRAALVSKYGINGVRDLVNYPLDFVASLYSALKGNVAGRYDKLFQDFLDSGTAGTTVQEYLTPEALTTKARNPLTKAAAGTLDAVGDFATAIEQTSKILGVKRAMREHGAVSGKSLAKDFPEAITEIRRFSGSPDFGRTGKWTDAYRLNLIYMFLNARIQGAVADVGRLAGRDGAGMAGKTWLKMGAAVGIPTVMAYVYNHLPGNVEDYEQRPQKEKQNYWLIPKNSYITGPNGEKIRDYWKIPKREIAQWFGNAIEAGLDFARNRDPEHFKNFAQSTIESLSPVNIQGKNFQERVESIGGSLNPVIKAPLQMATGRDLYRHRNIVPDTMKNASPENQFTRHTSEVFKTLAQKMPDVAPEVLRSPLMLEQMTRDLTAGMLTQFMSKDVEGRNKVENFPLLQRFQAVPYTDSTEFENRMSKYEREGADAQLSRFRTAQKILDDNKGKSVRDLVIAARQTPGADQKLAERVVDLWQAQKNGITSNERRILALPTAQRAEFIMDELKGKTGEEKTAILRNYARKRIYTEAVAEQMAR